MFYKYNFREFRRLILYIAAGLFFSFFQTFALDEEEADTTKSYRTPSVTVTADRAIEGETPVPFTNFTQSEIKKTYTNEDVPELLSELPSILTYSENGNNIGYSYITMRGFDQHRISVFVNGVPQNDPEEHNVFWIDMPDLMSNAANVQVQRGAGVVNYGAASIGGSINITTSNFVEERGVKLFSGVGYQEFGSSGGAIQPISNKTSIEVSSGKVGKYAVYGRLSRINSTGYRDRTWSELNSYFLSAARFDENFKTQINLFGGPIRDGLGYTGIPKEYIDDPKLRRKNLSYWEYDQNAEDIRYPTPRRKQEIENFSQPHYQLLNDWQISENLNLHSVLFYYTGDGFFDYDGSWADAILADWTSNDYPNFDTTYKNAIIRGAVSNKHGGWIPRIEWDHGSGELSVGTEIRIHRSEHYGKLQYSERLPDGYDPDYKFYTNYGERDIFSIFASERYDLTDKLSINIEGQLVRQSYRLRDIKRGNDYISFVSIEGDTVCEDGGELFDINHWFFNPRLGFNYDIYDNMNTYFSVAYTSREPRMKNYYNADEAYFGSAPFFEKDSVGGTVGYDFSEPLVEPESLLDFELGWNYRTPDYFINLNGYWMEYFDELVSGGVVDIWGRPIDGNVPRTRHAGIEIQGGVTLIDEPFGRVNLSGNATLSANRIIEFDFVTNAGDTVSLADNHIAGFPDEMGNIRLSYQREDFYCSLLGQYVGGFRTDNYGDLITDERIQTHLANNWNIYKDNKVEPYFILNADLSYTFRDVLTLRTLKIMAKANNILNNLYASYGIGKAFFPGAERNFFVGIELGL